MTNELRSELAKLIYLLTSPKQRLFREKFPTPIEDWQVEPAIEHAKKLGVR